MNDDPARRIEEAYDAYADPIFRFCAFMLADRERAIELMQETFIKTWEYIEKGNQIEDVRPFLYMVARNLCRNEITRGRRSESLDALVESGTEFEDASLPNAADLADAALLREHIDRLPAPMREVIVLRHIDGLPVTEIASILKESQTAVSVRIHRALKRLQQSFNTRQ